VDIKTIADAIPTSKDDVFAAVVDWSVLSDRVLSTLRAWVRQKVTELLGEEEPSLTDFIAEKLAAHTAAPALLTELTEVLDEEAEGFVLRLYRTVLYETKKAAAGLS
jgi:RNA-binding protein 25